MKLLTLGLAIILLLVLLAGRGPVVQADSDNATVQVEVEVVSPPPPPPPPPAGGPPPIYLTTNLFGIEGSFRISSDGIIQETIIATSADGRLTITIPARTKALDKDGKPLTTLTAVINPTPPPPPAGTYIIGLPYDFKPDGANFDPPITFTWSYDPAALPEGVAEEDLVIAYYDATAGKWVELESVVDTVNNKITAYVAHFTTFAIIGKVRPAAFSLHSLVVSPTQVAPGEEVNISVSVANTGGIGGSYTVVLKISGVREADKSVTVAASASTSVSFSVTKEEAGSYTVTVDGLSGSFVVVAPTKVEVVPPPEEEVAPLPEEEVVPPPPAKVNWPLIGAILACVVVIGFGVFVFILVKRRAL